VSEGTASQMRNRVRDPWDRTEVEAIVADYFHMLTLHFVGQTYNKSAHRRALQRKLRHRSEGSIERKHENISAILRDLRCHHIPGYKPLSNYQRLLFEVVADRVSNDAFFDRATLAAVEQLAIVPPHPKYQNTLVERPARMLRTEEAPRPYEIPSRAIRRDYLDLEARNRSLGAAGESFVVGYEQYRLRRAGKPALSQRVEHISRTRGDGLGYDILSFEVDGQERWIEVKTTAFGRETPFFLSRNEVQVSTVAADRYHVYRVFDFRRHPKMFDLSGNIQDHCYLEPLLKSEWVDSGCQL